MPTRHFRRGAASEVADRFPDLAARFEAADDALHLADNVLLGGLFHDEADELDLSRSERLLIFHDRLQFFFAKKEG